MKIITLNQFLTCPIGTIFQEYAGFVFGALEIFEGAVSADGLSRDYYYEDFSCPTFEDVTGTTERYCLLKSMENFAKAAPVVFGQGVRRRYLTPPHQLFAIYERHDVEQRYRHLTALLQRGYGALVASDKAG